MTSAAPHQGSRALAWLRAQSWAMPAVNLQQMIAIASRTNDGQIDALLADPGREVHGAHYTTMRGSVAVLQMVGPIFRRANLFTAISGATSHDVLAQEFKAAVTSPQVSAIVLEVDSPGGQVSGTSELARMIHASRGSKPIIAYAAMAASAAYWIASAADRIVISDTGQVGSIGVVQMVNVSDDPETVEIVSSQSPSKRPDVRTDGGRAQLQSMVDEIAQVFIDSVAEFRGISSTKVLANFGQGALRVGRSAALAGMADEVGTLEDLVSRLSGEGKTRGVARGEAVGTDPASQWAASPELQREFASTEQYVAYMRAFNAGWVTHCG